MPGHSSLRCADYVDLSAMPGADSLFDRNGRIGSALTEDDVKALFEI